MGETDDAGRVHDEGAWHLHHAATPQPPLEGFVVDVGCEKWHRHARPEHLRNGSTAEPVCLVRCTTGLEEAGERNAVLLAKAGPLLRRALSDQPDRGPRVAEPV